MMKVREWVPQRRQRAGQYWPSVRPGVGTVIKKIALLASLAATLSAIWYAGVFDAFREPERVKALLLGWEAWGWVLYILCFALIEPLGVPGVVFVVSAGMIWPKPIAFGLSLLSSLLAGSMGFGFARFLARDWVERRLPARFRRFDDVLGRRGLEAVILIRLVFFLAPPAHWVLGLSKVSYRTFLVGSAIGLVPGIAVLTFLGGSLFEWLLARPPRVWAVAASVVVAALLARFVLRPRV